MLGARPLRRLIQNEVEDLLSEQLLSGTLNAGDVAVVDAEEDAIVIHAKAPDETPDEDPAEVPALPAD